MKEVTVEITNESGLHARPATAFTQLAAKFASKLTIAANGKTADAKSILTVLTLGATKGTSVVLTADGADEDDALAALSEFLTTNHDYTQKRQYPNHSGYCLFLFSHIGKALYSNCKVINCLSTSPCCIPSRTQWLICPSRTTWPTLCNADLAALIWASTSSQGMSSSIIRSIACT